MLIFAVCSCFVLLNRCPMLGNVGGWRLQTWLISPHSLVAVIGQEPMVWWLSLVNVCHLCYFCGLYCINTNSFVMIPNLFILISKKNYKALTTIHQYLYFRIFFDIFSLGLAFVDKNSKNFKK